jgi:RluA family pseudouridine synthase
MTSEISSRLLFEDEHLIAVNKIAGELVVADRWGLENKILLHRVGEYLRTHGHKKDATGRDLYAVHRLDRETSGVVLFAKHHEAHRLLSTMFESRQMEKRYWLWTCGCPDWQEKDVDLPLTRAKGKRGKGRSYVDTKSGKPSHTHFKRLQCYGDIAWLDAEPYTGRTHQIRVHAKECLLPLLNDTLYEPRPCPSHTFTRLSIKRIPLHAYQLGFTHPFTKQKITIHSPLDPELAELKHTLEQINRLI